MFMGHYGPAVWDTQRGRTAPLVPLWQAFLAVQAVDIVFSVLAIMGVEGSVMKDGQPVFHIPWSHSLLTSLIISIAAGAIFISFKPSAGRKGFIVVSLLAFSHWVLDLVVHRPDLPLYPGGDLHLGFALWDYPLLSFAMEIGLLLLGFVYWMGVTKPKTVFYSLAPIVLFTFMCILQFIAITKPGLDLQAGTFDPATQPQGVVLGVSGLFAFGLLTVCIWAIERGRRAQFGEPLKF
ncbi:hypothetical protein DES40_1089 [Litorimonas taeanensis]|uniref:Uncharacterized protein n=1 Tax=Litorimonas taeanensis TaxID=568099 RepID=A0A420WLA4_9PROT|nr:hypothetical protein [Litorimonas taeanensis]RKQ71759.1 hypothetical protein DES40_1089 [Litorimonas taeanensis]